MNVHDTMIRGAETAYIWKVQQWFNAYLCMQTLRDVGSVFLGVGYLTPEC